MNWTVIVTYQNKYLNRQAKPEYCYVVESHFSGYEKAEVIAILESRKTDKHLRVISYSEPVER